MSTVTTIVVSPVAVIEWAKANDHKELLSVLMPYEDPETLDDIWRGKGTVADSTAEVDFTRYEGPDNG